MSQQALLPGMPTPPAYGDDLDFYSTPQTAVLPVLDCIPRLRSTVWNVLEPAAGEGALLRWFAPSFRRDTRITAVELNKVRCSALCETAAELSLRHNLDISVDCADFLERGGRAQEMLDRAERARPLPWLILTNPPYSKPYERIGLDFMVRCLTIAAEQPQSVVAALLPLDFATGVDRTKEVHERWQGSLYPLKRRQDFGGEHGSGQRPVAWYVWDLWAPRNEYRVIG